MCIFNLNMGMGVDMRVPQPCQPASVIKFMSSRFSERPNLKTKEESKWGRQPCQPVGTHMVSVSCIALILMSYLDSLNIPNTIDSNIPSSE